MSAVSSPRQFVVCKFRKEDRRSYTYHFDGELLAPGDEVRVEDRSGDGTKRIHVVAVHFDEPSFATKPIVSKVEPEPGEQGELSAPRPTAITLDENKLPF